MRPERLCDQKLQFRASFRRDNAAFEQNCSHLVRQRRAIAHQPITGTMQGLHVELVLTFERDETHCWTNSRLGNRLSVPIVILLCLHLGAYMPR